MPGYWILKTEPSTYSFDRLVKERRAVWDGVSNALALKHIRSMAPGDPLMIYHSGATKEIVGLAHVTSQPRADGKNPKLSVVDIEVDRRLPKTVSLAAVKADPAFADLPLVRQPRLSVIPVPEPQWRKLLEMAGLSS